MTTLSETETEARRDTCDECGASPGAGPSRAWQFRHVLWRRRR